MELWTVIIAEEQPVIRQGIRSIVEQLDVLLTVDLSDVNNLPGVLERISGKYLLITNENGLTKFSSLLYGSIDNENLTPAVLLLSSNVLPEKVGLIEESYIQGLILSGASTDEWLFAIRRIMKGETYVASEYALQVPRLLRNSFTPRNQAAEIKLSPREKKVLSLVAEGYTNKEIADRIFASQRTVEAHRMRLIGKTGARNTATLVKLAVMKGLID